MTTWKVVKYAVIAAVLGPFVVVSGVLLFWLGRSGSTFSSEDLNSGEWLDVTWDDDKGFDVDDQPSH